MQAASIATDSDKHLPDKTLAARRRIEAVYSPQLTGMLAHRWADLIVQHFQRVMQSGDRVLNWNPPADNVMRARRELDCPRVDRVSVDGDNLEVVADHFAALMQTILENGNNLHDPRYIGHQVPASVPIAALFDAIGSATNQVMAIYEMGPWASAVERAVIAAMGEEIGLPAGSYAGLITHGGSLANLTSLLTARNVSLPGAWESGVARPGRPPVIVVHGDVHYGVTRSAGILGLGTRQVLRAPLDERRRMDPGLLDQLLTDLRHVGQPVIAVVACACATPTGAFDPLEAIADVCERHHVWLHVDAAHGGAAAFSDRYRHLVKGLQRADSFICDAHKMMFVPALCAFVFYKDAAHRFDAFRQDAPYLFDPSTPGDTADFDSGLFTVECTKRAAAFGLWGVWSLFGRQLFSDLVDVTFSLGRAFATLLREQPDFVPLHEPECNIVVFRHIPAELKGATSREIGEFNRQIRRRLIESGEFYIVQTNLDGAGALRVTFMNPLTTLDHTVTLLEAIRRIGHQLLLERGSSGGENPCGGVDD